MVYAISDIHGCYFELLEALEVVDLSGTNKLILLGDYIDGGGEDKRVLDKIIELQRRYGSDKVIALMGNHETMAFEGFVPRQKHYDDYEGGSLEEYFEWMEELPLYYVEGNTIFVHAGIDEGAGIYWESETDDYTFTDKYPPQTGKFDGGMIIVAGHTYTSTLARDRNYHDIFFDGLSHYYIDGDVLTSGRIPVLAVDTEKDKYYGVDKTGLYVIEPFYPEGGEDF